jgi:hypothetical protein
MLWVFVPCSVLVCFDILRQQSASSMKVSELDCVVEDGCAGCAGSSTATHWHLPELFAALKMEVVCFSKASEQSKLITLIYRQKLALMK